MSYLWPNISLSGQKSLFKSAMISAIVNIFADVEKKDIVIINIKSKKFVRFRIVFILFTNLMEHK